MPTPPETEREPRVPDAGVRGLLQQANLDEHLPADHRLSTVYRSGAGLMGLILIVFGVLGFTQNLDFFDTGDETVLGLQTNGALSGLSVTVGALLLFGMVKGGNFASTLNIVIGGAFVLSGFVNLAVLERDSLNILNFEIQNVLFSFVTGVMLLMFGLYGRVSARLPHDNPYWQARHPDLAGEEQRMREEAAAQQRELMNRRRGGASREVPPPHN